MKSYSQCMNELTPDAVYKGLVLGMISDKLPPLFTMAEFWEKCQAQYSRKGLPAPGTSKCIAYDTVRNTGAPRRLGIPNPFCHENLCRLVKNHWVDLQDYFGHLTNEHPHKVSLIHVRKMRKSDLIFKMNYKERNDQEREVAANLRLGMKYLVRTDISSCYPSIYTHALTWALCTKTEAKNRWKNHERGFPEELDDYTRSLRDRESNGIPIGPVVSSILSELILVRVDEALCKVGKNIGFVYTRNIDDYSCYAKDRAAAEQFLVALKDALAEYNLSINYKKTEILELPLGSEDTWMQRLKAALAILPQGKIGVAAISNFLDTLVGLMKESGNGAVFSYAIKVVAKRFLNEEARRFYVKSVLHLAYCYPYLYPYLDEYVFYAFDVETDYIRDMAELMIAHGVETRNFEEVAYALFFAIKYGFSLKVFPLDPIVASQDCILKVVAWRYAGDQGLENERNALHAHALAMRDTCDFDEQWLFLYEALDTGELQGPWNQLKKAKVSFLQDTADLIPCHTPGHESYPIVWTSRIVGETPSGTEGETGFPKVEKEFFSDNRTLADNPLARQYLQCIVANLIVCSRLRRNVRIPRMAWHYRDLPPFGKDGEPHDPGLIKTILDWMRLRHWVGERVGTKETGASCFWPKDSLLDLFRQFDTGRIRCSGEDAAVVLKNADKKPVLPCPPSPTRDFYEDALTKINATYSRCEFRCRLKGAEVDDVFLPRLKAVFNDGNWGHGGRLYASATLVGINYQCIPSDLRKSISIDGKATVELDYSALHPTMIYAARGLQLPPHAYGFLPDEDVALAKFALLVMLNAKSKEVALAALKKRNAELKTATGLSDKKQKLRGAFLRHPNLDEVLALATEKHHAIQDSFFSGIGIELQNTESRMALDIVSRFAAQEIPVLPVHDSFIIEKSCQSRLRIVMKEVYSAHNNGFTCRVK